MLAKVTDCKCRQSASTGDGSRSPITSTIAAHRRSDSGRSAPSSAVQPSQNCAAHHPSLPGSARPASSRSSGPWPASRPRSVHHKPSADTSRAAVFRSCSTAQASACPMVASSASRQRAADGSPAMVVIPAAACPATRTAYRASATSASSCSPASASSPAP